MTAPPTDRLVLLVIEDDPGDARLIAEALRDEPFDLEYAARLAPAVARLAGGGVDLVLLDLRLPDAEGLNGLTTVLRGAPRVPVVVLTGLRDEAMGRSAVHAGAQDFLFKGASDSDSVVRTLRYAVERQRLVGELTAANTELRARNQAMRDFVAVASHDLRLPLVVVGGFARLLTENWSSLTDAERRSMAEAIDRNACNLGHFVDDLITLSSIENGGLRVRPRPVGLKQALSEYVRERDLPVSRVSVSCPPRLEVVVDPHHLTRILDNYLQNAFKYGVPPVRVDAARHGAQVEVRVRDRGPGVPPEFVPQLFTKFARADHPDVVAQRGSGLGLSIVRGLAEANAGQAYYEPESPDGDWAFVLRLPRYAPPLQTAD